jgi:hypothetical protein
MGSGTSLIVGEGFFTQEMLLAEMLVCVCVLSYFFEEYFVFSALPESSSNLSP